MGGGGGRGSGYHRGMSIIYDAQMNPDKQAILEGWVPAQPWARGGSGQLRRLGAYRFDDPAGEVGLEGHLIRLGDGPILHVPLSYRGSADPALAPWLVATTDHSVLGRRFVYDAIGDPVYTAAVVAAIRGALSESEQFLSVDGELSPIPASAVVRGSGEAPGGLGRADFAAAAVTEGEIALSGETVLLIHRRPGAAQPAAGAGTLTGELTAEPGRLLLAEAALA